MTNYVELKVTMYRKLLALALVMVISALFLVPGADALQSDPRDPTDIVGFALSPTIPQYATVRRNGAVEITNVQTGDVMGPYFVPLPFQDVMNLDPLEYNVRDIVYSPDGSQIAVTISDYSAAGVVYLLNWESGQIRQAHSASSIHMINDISWSPDGSRLVLALQYGGTDQLILTSVEILDLDSGESERTLAEYYPTGNYAFGVVDWSGSGVIAYADRSSLILWDANSNTEQGIAVASDQILDAAWSPDSIRIATVNSDSSIQIWDINSDLSTPVLTLPIQEEEKLRTRYMTWLNNDLLAVDMWSGIYVWNVSSASLDQFIDVGNSLAIGMGVNTNGEFVYAAGSQLIDVVPIPGLETATPTPTPTFTPTPPPTLTPTPAATPTPAPFQRLRLTSLCSANPAAYRLWRIRNSNPYDVVFTWDVYRSPTAQNGFGVAPPAVNGVASEVIISTVAEAGANTLRLFVTGAQQDVKASSGATCPTPTPAP